jgi:hypothetical protein
MKELVILRLRLLQMSIIEDSINNGGWFFQRKSTQYTSTLSSIPRSFNGITFLKWCNCATGTTTCSIGTGTSIKGRYRWCSSNVAIRRATRQLMDHEAAIEKQRQLDDHDLLKLELPVEGSHAVGLLASTFASVLDHSTKNHSQHSQDFILESPMEIMTNLILI